MSNNKRCYHIRSGFAMQLRAVENGIEKCALTWVVKGETYRELTEKEAAEARAKQAFEREPIGLAEGYGLRYEPAVGQEAINQRSRRLAALRVLGGTKKVPFYEASETSAA